MLSLRAPPPTAPHPRRCTATTRQASTQHARHSSTTAEATASHSRFGRDSAAGPTAASLTFSLSLPLQLLDAALGTVCYNGFLIHANDPVCRGPDAGAFVPAEVSVTLMGVSAAAVSGDALTAGPLAAVFARCAAGDCAGPTLGATVRVADIVIANVTDPSMRGGGSGGAAARRALRAVARRYGSAAVAAHPPPPPGAVTTVVETAAGAGVAVSVNPHRRGRRQRSGAGFSRRLFTLLAQLAALELGAYVPPAPAIVSVPVTTRAGARGTLGAGTASFVVRVHTMSAGAAAAVVAALTTATTPTGAGGLEPLTTALRAQGLPCYVAAATVAVNVSSPMPPIPSLGPVPSAVGPAASASWTASPGSSPSPSSSGSAAGMADGSAAMSGGVIAGIVIGSLVVAGVLVVAACVLWRGGERAKRRSVTLEALTNVGLTGAAAWITATEGVGVVAAAVEPGAGIGAGGRVSRALSRPVTGARRHSSPDSLPVPRRFPSRVAAVGDDAAASLGGSAAVATSDISLMDATRAGNPFALASSAPVAELLRVSDA